MYRVDPPFVLCSALLLAASITEAACFAFVTPPPIPSPAHQAMLLTRPDVARWLLPPPARKAQPAPAALPNPLAPHPPSSPSSGAAPPSEGLLKAALQAAQELHVRGEVRLAGEPRPFPCPLASGSSLKRWSKNGVRKKPQGP